MLRIAERRPGLLPNEANVRARAIAGMFAAHATMQPPIVEREAAILMEKDKSWFADACPPWMTAFEAGSASFLTGLAIPSGWTVPSASAVS